MGVERVNMASWRIWAGRRTAALALGTVLAGAGLVAACSPHPGAASGPVAEQEEGILGRTALSAYLAGRLAQAEGDTRAAADYYTEALKYDPDNADLLQRAFTLMVAEGRLEQAMPLAERLLDFDSDAPLPLLVAGLRAARDGHFEQSEKHFAALPKRGVFGFLSPLLVAWSKVGAGQIDPALESLAALGAVQGLEPMRAYHAGLINDLAGRADAADAAYLQALDGQASIRLVEAAGAFHQRAGRPEQAKALYDRYLGEHPDTLLIDGGRLLAQGASIPRTVPDASAGMAEALFDMGSLMRQGGALDMAMVFSRLTLALRPDFALARMNVADILSSQGRYVEGNAAYQAIPATSPVAEFGRLRVAMNLEEMGQTEEALRELDVLARERPDGLDALVTKGDILRRQQRFADAATAYDAAIRRVPRLASHHWPLLYSRGIAYERSGEWPKAEADFQKALELRPDQPDVLNYLSYSWIDKGVHLAEARAMIEKAVTLRPRDGAIVDSLGWALYRMGEFQGAVKALERAVELKPEDPTINDHLGDAYFQVGRFPEASFQWKRALSLEPEAGMLETLEEKVRSGTLPAVPLSK